MYIKLYQLASLIAGPFIDLYLMYRKRNGREDTKRFKERLGYPGKERPSGSLVWVHAASIGESISILPLVDAIITQYKDIHVLITTGTVTSAKLLESRLPARTLHQYVPIDKVITVRRFLNYWRPDLALWVESELWPTLTTETHKTGCQMVQVNARISVAAHQKWQRYSDLAKRMLSCFSLSLAQSEGDSTRLTQLGARNSRYIGNLKFDAPALPAEPKATGELVAAIGERPLWIAASTHPGEEDIVADTHIQLQKTYPDLLTIIIPRHPERGGEIRNIASKHGLSSGLRSQKKKLTEDIDIYIADTIGELGIFYRLSNIVFMGGSLVAHGGQNPLEAARLECALLTGPHTENFAQIYEELSKENAVIIVKNDKDLATQIDLLLQDHERQDTLASTAAELIASKEGALKQYMEALSPYLKPLSQHSAANDENA